MATRPDSSSFEDKVFTSRTDTAEWLVSRALELAPERRLHMLDLGCGTGSVAISAARARSDLEVVALDIAATNVAAARAAADQAGVGSRVKTVCADFVHWRGGPFDVIVSDSVLYVISGDDETIAQRLAEDLAPGGVMVITTPIESIANRIRIALRHLWRMMPPALDQLPFAVARRLYPKFTEQALTDRVAYLRIIPVRLYGRAFAEILRRAGIETMFEEPMKSPSIAKLTHRLVALRRTTST
jgi:trans-aconitate 2-methyltransferase